MNTSKHSIVVDRLIKAQGVEFTCRACQEERALPKSLSMVKEARGDNFRADIGMFDGRGIFVGAIEVIDTHPPSSNTLFAQSQLTFAVYCHLPRPTPKRRRDYFWLVGGVFTPDGVRNHKGQLIKMSPDIQEETWLCSVECYRWWQIWGGWPRSEPWEAPKCSDCGDYICQNPLSRVVFLDAENPYYPSCIHCAADQVGTQWRFPGELAGGDPREWTPDDAADPATLFLAYCDAIFWSKVWRNRVAQLGWTICDHCNLENVPPLCVHRDHSGWWCRSCGTWNQKRPEPPYDGSNNDVAEHATASRLSLVEASFDAGEWAKGSDLLLPIAAPQWQAFPGETVRMLAFRPENCRVVARSWERLLAYRLEQLPIELIAIIVKHRID